MLAAFVDFPLFCWREVATGNLLEEFVGNLLCAVADRLEGQGCHLSRGLGNPDVEQVT